MPVGNDIVAFESAGRLHPRFATRVLAPSEFAIYVARDCADEFLWLAWAAKETAYKWVKQRKPEVRFIWSQFVFDPETMTVTYGDETIPLQFQVTGEYVHCFSGGECAPLTAVTTCDEDLSPSAAVRRLARKLVAEKLRCAPDDVTIEKDAHGIPTYRRGALTGALSLSHHGAFVAAAVGELLS